MFTASTKLLPTLIAKKVVSTQKIPQSNVYHFDHRYSLMELNDFFANCLCKSIIVLDAKAFNAAAMLLHAARKIIATIKPTNPGGM